MASVVNLVWPASHYSRVSQISEQPGNVVLVSIRIASFHSSTRIRNPHPDAFHYYYFHYFLLLFIFSRHIPNNNHGSSCIVTSTKLFTTVLCPLSMQAYGEFMDAELVPTDPTNELWTTSQKLIGPNADLRFQVRFTFAPSSPLDLGHLWLDCRGQYSAADQTEKATT